MELWEYQMAVECFNERAEEQAESSSSGRGAGRTLSVEEARAQGLVPG